MENPVTVLINSYKESEETFIKTLESVKRANPGQIIISTVNGDNCLQWIKEDEADIVVNEKAGIYEQINNALKYVNQSYFTYFS